MIPRLITACIFLFCGVMTAKLVHSVLYPEGSDLAKVSPRIVFDHFIARSEGSNLDVWEGNNIIGNCQITPHGPVMIGEDGTPAVKVNLTVLILLPREMLDSQTIKLMGGVLLHSNGELDNLDLELSLPGSIPRISLEIFQPTAGTPCLTLKRGNEVLFSTAPGQKQDSVTAMMVESMLKSAGLSMDTLSASPDKKEAHVPEARTGWFSVGDHRIDGYLLSNGADTSARFDLYMETTGEILRIDTPLTGENKLGLRFLGESKRPPGAAPPSIDEFHRTKSQPKKKEK